MRDNDLERIQRMKQVLKLSAAGSGIAAAMVEVFAKSSDRQERDSARRILLGTPLEKAVRRMTASRGSGPSDLLRYIVAEGKVNTANASRRAERLAVLFERWAEIKRAGLAEEKVFEARGHLVCAILGAVMALLATLAPVISSFQLSFTHPLATAKDMSLAYMVAGGAFALVSAAFLGAYLSPRRRKIDPLLALISYAVVSSFVAPFASLPLLP